MGSAELGREPLGVRADGDKKQFGLLDDDAEAAEDLRPMAVELLPKPTLMRPVWGQPRGREAPGPLVGPSTRWRGCAGSRPSLTCRTTTPPAWRQLALTLEAVKPMTLQYARHTRLQMRAAEGPSGTEAQRTSLLTQRAPTHKLQQHIANSSRAPNTLSLRRPPLRSAWGGSPAPRQMPLPRSVSSSCGWRAARLAWPRGAGASAPGASRPSPPGPSESGCVADGRSARPQRRATSLLSAGLVS